MGTVYSDLFSSFRFIFILSDTLYSKTFSKLLLCNGNFAQKIYLRSFLIIRFTVHFRYSLRNIFAISITQKTSHKINCIFMVSDVDLDGAFFGHLLQHKFAKNSVTQTVYFSASISFAEIWWKSCIIWRWRDYILYQDSAHVKKLFIK